jgi:hypothetical protein
VAGGVNRLRLAAESMADLLGTSEAGRVAAEPLRAGEPESVLDDRGARLHAWFIALADLLERRRTDLPPVPPADAETAVVALLRRTAPDGGRSPAGLPDAGTNIDAHLRAVITARALRLAWISLYLDDASDVARRVAGPALTLRSAAPPVEPDGTDPVPARASAGAPASSGRSGAP